MQNLGAYRLSQNSGALLEFPQIKLPSNLEPWNELIENLPELFKTKELRKKIDQLQLLDYTNLKSHEELRLAHKILAFLASTYIWQYGEGGETDSLPIQIALPLLNISKQLGLQPILTHSDLVLANCIEPDVDNDNSNIESKYCCEQCPLKVIHLPTHHEHWKTFISISGAVEKLFAPIPELMLNAIQAQNYLDEKCIENCLNGIHRQLEKLQKSLVSMYDKLNPEQFYVDLRPLLCGWTRGRLKDGLIYECSMNRTSNQDCEQKMKYSCIGPSAAQSICLQVCDAFLQINHSKSDEEFFATMRSHMITEHRKFIEDLLVHSKIRSIVLSTNSTELKSAYNACLQALYNFRNYHLLLTKKFIIDPSRTNVAKVKSLETAGTGGQDLSMFLQRICDATKKQV